jgi:geranylgeranyl diphosphate synthase type II
MSSARTVTDELAAGFAIEAFCAACRPAVLAEIRRILDEHGWPEPELQRLIFEYPLRPAKALRPALCIATARSLGGADEGVIGTASVLELLHNAFLIHDDIEDESWFRRGEATLHRAHGLAIAVNAGDAMFALSLASLLDHTARLGLRATLEIVDAIAAMLRVTVGGQALELSWIRHGQWEELAHTYRASYENMVVRKTATYSFITPVSLGCISAGAPPRVRTVLTEFARSVGIAFQIVDDLLNLRDDTPAYGKEADGDLWEGKRTLILLHALHEERDPEALTRALATLSARRPPTTGAAEPGTIYKTADGVAALRSLIERHGSAAFARGVALEHAAEAVRRLDECRDDLAPGASARFLASLPAYVVERLR